MFRPRHHSRYSAIYFNSAVGPSATYPCVYANFHRVNLLLPLIHDSPSLAAIRRCQWFFESLYLAGANSCTRTQLRLRPILRVQNSTDSIRKPSDILFLDTPSKLFAAARLPLLVTRTYRSERSPRSGRIGAC